MYGRKLKQNLFLEIIFVAQIRSLNGSQEHLEGIGN